MVSWLSDVRVQGTQKFFYAFLRIADSHSLNMFLLQRFADLLSKVRLSVRVCVDAFVQLLVLRVIARMPFADAVRCALCAVRICTWRGVAAGCLALHRKVACDWEVHRCAHVLPEVEPQCAQRRAHPTVRCCLLRLRSVHPL